MLQGYQGWYATTAMQSCLVSGRARTIVSKGHPCHHHDGDAKVSTTCSTVTKKDTSLQPLRCHPCKPRCHCLSTAACKGMHPQTG